MSLNPDPNSLASKGKSFLKSAAGRQVNILKRRILRGLGLLVMAGIAWAATQMGLLSDKATESQVQQDVSQQKSSQQNANHSSVTATTQGNNQLSSSNRDTSARSSSSSKGSIQTLRLADPLERGESHVVTNETKLVKTWTHKRSNDNAKIAELFKAKRSDTWVTAFGKVGKVLPDDNKGSRHQRFLMDIGQQKWLLIAHNIDLAPYVPLKKGDALVVHGEYEYNEKGGVIHWTHHDPRGYKDGGYIEHRNKRYE